MASMNGSEKATRAISPSADLITDSGLASGRGRRGAGRSCLQRIGVDIIFGGKVAKAGALYCSLVVSATWSADILSAAREHLARISRQLPKAGRMRRTAGKMPALRKPALLHATVISSDR